MLEMIEEPRLSSDASERMDLFSNLLRACDEDMDKKLIMRAVMGGK